MSNIVWSFLLFLSLSFISIQKLSFVSDQIAFLPRRFVHCWGFLFRVTDLHNVSVMSVIVDYILSKQTFNGMIRKN